MPNGHKLKPLTRYEPLIPDPDLQKDQEIPETPPPSGEQGGDM